MNSVLTRVAVSEIAQGSGAMSRLYWFLHAKHGACVANDAIQHLLTQRGGKRLAVPTVAKLIERNRRRITGNIPDSLP